MRNLLLTLSFFLISTTVAFSQTVDTVKQQVDSLEKDSDGIGSTVNKLFGWGKEKDEKIEALTQKVKIQKDLIDSMSANPKILIKAIPTLDPAAAKSIKVDEKFINDLPKSYNNVTKTEVVKLTKQIDQKIGELIRQRDSILSAGGSTDFVDAKNNVIKSLQREKSVIHLSEESNILKTENTELNVENTDLKVEADELKGYLYTALSVLFVLLLVVAVITQRRKIQTQDVEIDRQLADINKKNNYLEHAARIIRHDMHSGINTYMPRGLSSLERQIDADKAKELKIEGPIKMIKEGLSHTQKVYKSVYEFTNLVKKDVVLDVKLVDLGSILSEYICTMAYSNQVEIDGLTKAKVNASLFCTAIDNLVRNGLNFNDSERKLIKIYMDGENLVVEDNGRGLSTSKFEEIKRNRDTEGLGLSIALAIVEEHGFELNCEQIETGTKMKIKLK